MPWTGGEFKLYGKSVRGPFEFSPEIDLTTDDMRILDRIRDIIGDIRIEEQEGGKYKGRIFAKDIRIILTKILQYMDEKREQAEILLTHINLVNYTEKSEERDKVIQELIDKLEEIKGAHRNV